MMNSSKFLSLLLVLILQSLLSVECVEESFIECIDLKSQLEDENWKQNPAADFGYADSSQELPDELKGKLDGEGIFYFTGKATSPNQAIFKKFSNLTTPTHFYIKYYGHVTNPEISKMYVSPGKSVYITPLDGTKDFVWNERIIELDVDKANNPGFEPVEFAATTFQDGEFFLVDRFAVVSGSSSMISVQDVEEYCWPEPTTTSTEDPSFTSTPITRVTTTKGPSSDDGLSTFQILLYIVLPGVVVLAIVLLVMYYCRRHRDSRKNSRQHLVI